ncbi:MAG: zinc ribbon domain-containing protein [Treponema sp.]|jgi:hypothetical protein|nr:zinc ribbon domain-containing protein [Treponema sp.]
MKRNAFYGFFVIVLVLGFFGCSRGNSIEDNDNVFAGKIVMDVKNEVSICQSCEMPMDGPSKFGTNADGSKSDDYCVYCWKNGRFTEPNKTFVAAVEFNIPFVLKAGLAGTEDEARTMISASMSKLKRWAAN